MPTSDTARNSGDGMVCSADGVVVRVRPREARGEVPAYEYVVRSERHGPVAVRVRQPIPEDVDSSDLGFPSTCEEHWRLDGAALVARFRVEPDDEVRTVWGVRDDAHPPIDAPEVDVEPVGDAAGDLSAGEDAGDSLDLEDPGEFDGGVADGGASAGTAGAAGSTPQGGAGSEPQGAPAVGDETLVARMLEELESGAADTSHRRALADALEFQASESTNAFVEHVQSKVERRADRLERDLEEIEESVDQLYGVKADASDVASLKRGLTDLDDKKVDAAELRDVREGLQEVQSTVAALVERVEALPDQEEFAAIESRLAELEAGLEEVEQAHERLDRNHDELAAEAATAEDVEDVRGSYRDHVNEAKSEVADLRELVEEECVTAEDLDGRVDRHVGYGVATLALFGVGAAGLAVAILLAIQGEALVAGGTFAAGAAAMVGWLRRLRSNRSSRAGS